MQTKQIINRFGIKQTLINMTIGEMKSNEDVDKSNFFDCTVANWNEVDVDFIPDHKSESGSQYMYTDKGIYRKSNHWNYGVNTCVWLLNSEQSESETIAFCGFENFKKYSAKRIDHKLSRDYIPLQENISDMLSGEMVLKHRIGNLN